jgi:hypothetical protein
MILIFDILAKKIKWRIILDFFQMYFMKKRKKGNHVLKLSMHVCCKLMLWNLSRFNTEIFVGENVDVSQPKSHESH